MKRLHNMPLRLRVTLLTGGMILLASFVLTAASMVNAEGQLAHLQKNATASFAETIPIDPSSWSSLQDGKAAYDSNLNQNKMDLQWTPADWADGEPLANILISATETAQTQFNYWSILALALVAVMGMGVSYYVAGRALMPVQRLSQAAENISAQNLQMRLPDCEVPDEIGNLTRSFNEMLARLEQAFEGQRQFSSNVAHELKTPLATMKLCMQTARLEESCDEEFLDVTERSIDRLSGVVDDLLLLTNDALVRQREPLSLPRMLEAIVAELSPLYGDKGLQIAYDFPQEEAIVSANSSLTHHLFSNLIENGMKYNVPQGALTLAVAIKEGYLEVTVADSGVGIPAEALPHLFEPFYCVDPSRSRKLGGAGLGLSIANNIAEKHGWIIRVESPGETGASFTVSIPLTK